VVDRALRFDLLGRDKTLGRTLGHAEGRMARFGRTMGRVSLVGAAALGGLGVAAATMGVKTLASLESADTAFTRLLGSGKKAQRFIGDLKAFARRTPFELPGLIDTARRLLGAGQAAGRVIPSLRAWGDAAGALGLDQERFGRVTLAVTQIMNKQRVQAEELLQISEAGIPIYPLLAKALHKPIPELQQLMLHGKLLAKDVLPKLEAQMEKDYGGSMAAQSKTLSGLWSTLMDTLNIGLADTLLPFQDAIKGGLTAAIKGLGLAFEGIPEAVDSVFGKDGALGNIDLGKAVKDLERLSEPFRSAAKGWTNAIIGGFKEGLKTGDWGDLGAILGNVLARVIGNGADLMKRAFSGVDWVEVGGTVGSGAFGFAVGFVSHLFDDFLKVVKEHPLDLAIFFSSFIVVGKAAGPLLKIVERIPILRAFVGPLLRMIEKASAPFRSVGAKLFRFLGDGFLEGLERVMPRTVRFLKRVIGDVVAWLALRAESFRKGGSKMIRNLAGGIGEQIGLVVRDIGRVVRAITRPFVGSAVWLVRRGSEAIAGLIRGVRQMLAPVTARLAEVKRRILSPFAGAASWLYHKGASIIGGLISGARSMLGSVGNFVSNLKDAIVGGIKRLFHISSPSRVMFGLGAHMVEGLVRGLLSSSRNVTAVVKSIGGSITDWFGGIGASLFGGGGGGGGGPVAALVKSMAAALYGWTGAQWSALSRLLMGESGFNPNAQNPTSTAYGLFQFLNSTWAAMGARKTSDPAGQTVAGLRYIARVYGSPIRALAAWMSRTPHWYGKGGIFTRPSIIGVGEAGTEAVVPLDRASEFGLDGGRSVVVNLNFYGPVIGGADAFVREVTPKIRTALKAQLNSEGKRKLAAQL
jgi:tape measure domain-containing protein